VLLVTKAARFRMGKPALINAIGDGCRGGRAAAGARAILGVRKGRAITVGR
jgi:hypothetical protein